ncbi:MAG: hypothetical protein DCC67_00595 [Planctomycetota bacterium]|nr:MAG: hypothetical protein DCC67_00595 [Planctomycetota bacterium]
MPPIASTSVLASPAREPRRGKAGLENPVSRADAAGAASRPKRDLQRAVLDALWRSGYAALSFIGCDVDAGRVVLRGSVPSYHLKQLAQVCARRVDGVAMVENRLTVSDRAST